MKKLITLLMILMMIFTFAACGGGNVTPQDEGGGEGTEVSQDNDANVEDPNAPVSSVNDAIGRGSYTKHDSDDAQDLLAAMGLTKYMGGEIIYATQFEDDNSGTVYINETTIEDCINYCKSLSGTTPAYEESNSNGKYVNYVSKNDGYEFNIKFFEDLQKKTYKLNGEDTTDEWQVEIDFTPLANEKQDAPSGPAIAEGWEIPEYPYGELVYTKYDDNGNVTSLYFNNTTVNECHDYCLTLEKAGYLEVTNNDIHEDSDGLGNYILYNAMHPSSYITYEISYEYDNMEHTIDTDSGEVAFQVVISNRGK